jgi:hypothetical protein
MRASCTQLYPRSPRTSGESRRRRPRGSSFWSERASRVLGLAAAPVVRSGSGQRGCEGARIAHRAQVGVRDGIFWTRGSRRSCSARSTGVWADRARVCVGGRSYCWSVRRSPLQRRGGWYVSRQVLRPSEHQLDADRSKRTMGAGSRRGTRCYEPAGVDCFAEKVHDEQSCRERCCFSGHGCARGVQHHRDVLDRRVRPAGHGASHMGCGDHAWKSSALLPRITFTPSARSRPACLAILGRRCRSRTNAIARSTNARASALDDSVVCRLPTARLAHLVGAGASRMVTLWTS